METKVTIGTHSGKFHTDDVMSCMMLSKYSNKFKNGEIVRTRDLNILKDLSIVVDVGGEYNPATNRFDHHQKSFHEVFEKENKIKMSSAGLVYKHYGKEIVENIVKYLLEAYKNQMRYNFEVNADLIEIVYTRLYKNLIMAVDALDNGIDQYYVKNYDKEKEKKEDLLICRYNNHTSLESRINRTNPIWGLKDNSNFDGQFKIAMEIANEELLEQAKSILFSWYPAKFLVEKAINSRKDIHDSLEIMLLEEPCTWKEHLFAIEQSLNIEKPIKYVLFEDSNSKEWRIQAINVSMSSFQLRKPLKKSWRGVTKVEEIEDFVFCHMSGFIGGAKSFESVKKMAILSLEDTEI